MCWLLLLQWLAESLHTPQLFRFVQRSHSSELSSLGWLTVILSWALSSGGCMQSLMVRSFVQAAARISLKPVASFKRGPRWVRCLRHTAVHNPRLVRTPWEAARRFLSSSGPGPHSRTVTEPIRGNPIPSHRSLLSRRARVGRSYRLILPLVEYQHWTLSRLRGEGIGVLRPRSKTPMARCLHNSGSCIPKHCAENNLCL